MATKSNGKKGNKKPKKGKKSNARVQRGKAQNRKKQQKSKKPKAGNSNRSRPSPKRRSQGTAKAPKVVRTREEELERPTQASLIREDELLEEDSEMADEITPEPVVPEEKSPESDTNEDEQNQYREPTDPPNDKGDKEGHEGPPLDEVPEEKDK
jgi:hypothetical protein